MRSLDPFRILARLIECTDASGHDIHHDAQQSRAFSQRSRVRPRTLAAAECFAVAQISGAVQQRLEAMSGHEVSLIATTDNHGGSWS